MTTPNSKKTVTRTGKYLIYTFVAFALFPSIAFSGAWVAKQGSGYGKISYSQYSADDYFGERDDLGEFNNNQTAFYGEYGLGNSFAVYGKLQFLDIDQSDNVGDVVTNSGLGDVDLGLRYQWNTEAVVLSTSVLVKLPYLYDEDDELPVGNGQEDIELRVLLGKSLNQFGYFGIEAGYRIRLDAPSDEYRYLIEYGFSVGDNAYFRTKLDGTLSADNADSSVDASGNLALAPTFDIGKLELTAGWNFGQANSDNSRWGMELTLTEDIYGDETLEGSNVEVALTRVF